MAASTPRLSRIGAPPYPVCSYKLVAAAGAVTIQDGAERFDVVVEQVDGDVRATWWDRALAANPQYGDAQGNIATIRLGMTSRQASSDSSPGAAIR
jgi:hypothetical protein